MIEKIEKGDNSGNDAAMAKEVEKLKIDDNTTDTRVLLNPDNYERASNFPVVVENQLKAKVQELLLTIPNTCMHTGNIDLKWDMGVLSFNSKEPFKNGKSFYSSYGTPREKHTRNISSEDIYDTDILSFFRQFKEDGHKMFIGHIHVNLFTNAMEKRAFYEITVYYTNIDLRLFGR